MKKGIGGMTHGNSCPQCGCEFAKGGNEDKTRLTKQEIRPSIKVGSECTTGLGMKVSRDFGRIMRIPTGQSPAYGLLESCLDC